MQFRFLSSTGRCLLAAIAILCQIIVIPAKADTPAISNPQTPTTAQLANDSELKTFPVGLNVGNQNVNPSILVRGKEDGSQAIDFANWLLPYNAVIQGLKLNVTTLPDGQLEMRSPGVVTRIDPKKLRTDPELGLVFSIQDLQTLFGVTAKFDISEYAIVLDVPKLNQSSGKLIETEAPIQLEGLPHIAPQNFSVAAVEQKVNASGSSTRSTSYRGDLIAVGSAFGGSWFIRTDQPNLQNQQTWNIAEAQFLRQTNSADYFIGSQPTFWQTQGTGDYWGFTSIQRQGFVPPQPFGGSSSDPRQRLQAAAIGRTISGKAEPGTLVRLVQGFADRVIAEILVDSSGIYRFENIKTENQFLGNNYRILLYSQGRLTAQPEIQNATFSRVAGQLPAGASALIFSGGLRRGSFGNQSLLGNFSDFRGGIAQRWGLSENLTVGLGGVYDESAKALAELFWQPANLPLQVAVSALTDNDWDVNTDIRYNPSPNLSAAFTSDRLSSRFNLDWRVFPQLILFTTTDSRDATSGGIQFNLSGKDAFTFARVSLDTKNRLRWNLLQRLGKLELTQRGNEISTLSELTYNLSQNRFSNSGSALLLNYETQNQNRSDNLLSVSWRYRSPQRAVDGSYQWEAQLGYGIGSQGSGPVATLSTTVLPGLLLRARYRSVSPSSDEATFSIDLASSLNLQGGITPGDRRSNYFRTQGGLLIKPFFDRNNNGKKDTGEEVYTDNANLLLTLNNKPLKSFSPQIQGDRTLVRMSPGIYRLDLDPAGLPPDWQAKVDALAVDVIAGSYTLVMIPLIRSYTRSGVVTDAQGKVITGARVEAIQPDQETRRFSVTNGAGVYYLEGLSQGQYNLQINGQSAGNLKLEESSEAFLELNLQQPSTLSGEIKNYNPGK
ncbi:carboxypeptidase-like regulatory domain-containing protein [Nostoc sp. WHI]|uniref:carboxypeptidase-like regulatory domain-containing protein n=1 Tax=Nostoc sp. WHI TaxID=2650611 RepID=UPI0018C7F14E|nr:carboxypeptidase regulatory-like domain-containing protein [Nostoc sp. WHI]